MPVNEVVDEDDAPGGYIELFISLGAPAGHGDDRDDFGLPLYYFKFTWLTPQRLLAIAADLVAAEERGEDVRSVVESWQQAELGGLLSHDDDENDT